MLIRIVGITIQLVIFATLAVLESVETVALFGIAAALWSISRGVGSVGRDQVLLREIPRVGEHCASFERQSSMIAFFAGGVGALLAALVASLGLIEGVTVVEFGPALIAIPVFSVVSIQSSRLRGRGYAARAQVGESIVSPMFFLGLYGFLRLSGAVPVHQVLMCGAVGVLAAAFFNSIMISVSPYPVLSESKGPLSSVRSMWISGIEIWIGQISNVLAVRLPVVVFATIATLHQVGVFEVAQRIALMSTLMTWAVGVAYSPLFSMQWNAGDVGALQRTTRQAILLALIPSTVLFITWAAMGHWLLALLGEKYIHAHIPLVILSGALAINAGLGVYSQILNMTGGQRVVAVASVVQFAISIGAIVVVGGTMGPTGAALAFSIGLITRDVACAWAYFWRTDSPDRQVR